MAILNKKELTDRIAEEYNMQKNESEELIEFILDKITETLRQDGEVSLFGFGKFTVRHRRERPGINPATKERITIKASNAVAFRSAKALKDAVNED